MYKFKFNEYPYNLKINKKYLTYNNLFKTFQREYINLDLNKPLQFNLYNNKNNKYLGHGVIHYNNIVFTYFCVERNRMWKNYFQQIDLIRNTLQKEEIVYIDHLHEREKIIEHFTLELKNHLNLDGSIDSQMHSKFKDHFLPLILKEYKNYYKK